MCEVSNKSTEVIWRVPGKESTTGLPHIHSQLPNSAGGATTPSHMLSAYPFLTATKSESQYFFLKDLKEIGVGSLFS